MQVCCWTAIVFLIFYCIPLADPGFGQGGLQKYFPRFGQHSEAQSGEQSEPILGMVQGPKVGPKLLHF